MCPMCNSHILPVAVLSVTVTDFPGSRCHYAVFSAFCSSVHQTQRIKNLGQAMPLEHRNKELLYVVGNCSMAQNTCLASIRLSFQIPCPHIHRMQSWHLLFEIDSLIVVPSAAGIFKPHNRLMCELSGKRCVNMMAKKCVPREHLLEQFMTPRKLGAKTRTFESTSSREWLLMHNL